MTRGHRVVPLRDDVLMAVGRLVADYGELEWTLLAHVRILILQPIGKAKLKKRPPHLRLGLKRRLALYRELAPFYYDEKLLAEVSAALSCIANVKDLRDWVIHGRIMPQEHLKKDLLIIFRSDESEAWTIAHKRRKTTAAEITSAADRCEEARQTLEDAFATLKLVPDPLPRRVS